MIKVATVFSGIGSFEHSLLKNKIPHEIVFACDIDPHCKKNYLNNYNLPQDKWYSDILEINGEEYKDQIDILVAGCPCQSFSIAGQRKGFEDPRGQLVNQFIKLLKKSQPKMFIFENVKGLTTHDKGETFKWILSQFELNGYKLQYSIISSKSIGFPQSRERIFVIGHRNDIPFKNVLSEIGKKKIDKKVKDYLEKEVDNKYFITNHKWQKWFCDQNLLNKQKMLIITENTEYIICQTARQYSSWYGNFVIVDKPKDLEFEYSQEAITTITENEFLPIGWESFNLKKVLKKTAIRRLTPTETLRLMGFDTDLFKTVCSDSQTYKQCGNSIIVNMFDEILKLLI